MKMRNRLGYATFGGNNKKEYPKNGDLRRIVIKVKTILHQRTDWAIVMLAEVVVMVLGDRDQACYHQRDDYGLQELH